MKNTARKQRAGDLFDYLASVQAATVDDIRAYLDCSKEQADQAIRDLRRILGDDDTINVPAVPNGHRKRWLYSLTGTMDGAQSWVVNRLKDAETRLVTVNAIAASVVRATDGRSVEGKKARLINRSLTRLIEDLHELKENPSLF